jgi:probable phosphoglycerate mutase
MKLFLDRIPDSNWDLRNLVEWRTTTTEDLAEWGYGDYEGLLTEQIRELRSSRGLDTTRPWQIMRDGCEGVRGESPAQVEQRLDRIISQITSLQAIALEEGHACDIVLFGHGHIFRAFVKRWLGFSIDAPVRLDFQFEPGSVCGLSYAHGDITDRMLLAGMRFPVPTTSADS